jgi:hypothetical protein
VPSTLNNKSLLVPPTVLLKPHHCYTIQAYMLLASCRCCDGWPPSSIQESVKSRYFHRSAYSYYSQRLLQNSPKLGQRNGLTPFFISSLVALLPCNLRVSMYHCVRMPSWCLVRKLGTTCVTLWRRNQTAGTAHEHSSSSCLSKSLVHCWTKADGRLLQEDQDRASVTTYNDTVVPPTRELSFYV